MNGLMIAYVVISVLIVILVLAQKSRDNGFSTMTGAKPSDGREVGKTFEKKMQAWTTWLVVAYIILSVVFTFYQTKLAADEQSTLTSDDIYQEADSDEVQAETVVEE